MNITLLAQQSESGVKYTISGKVVDAATKLPVEFASVYLVGTTTGVYTEPDGSFIIQTSTIADSLAVSELGYEALTIRLNPNKMEGLALELKETSFDLAEAIVVADKDPGKTLFRKIIARKSFNNPDKFDYYSYLKYTRSELDLNNIDRTKLKEKSLKLLMMETFNELDTANIQKNQLPIYFTETLTENHHSTIPAVDEEIIIAKKTPDLETDKLLRHLEKFNVSFNIYDDWLNIFEKAFASPISDKGLNYYNYYIEDSTQVADKWQYQIQFVPKRKYGETFTGMMWVNDSTYSVARIEMKMDATTNLNLVRGFTYKEEFTLHPDGAKLVYMPKKTISEVTFETGLDLLGLPIKVNADAVSLTYHNTVTLDRIHLDRNTLTTVPPVVGAPTNLNHIEQSEVFWSVNRLDTLTQHERAIYQTIDSVRNNPRFKFITKLVATATSGYWEVGDKWSLGHYSSLISRNPIEGFRFRLGFYSNVGLSENWFVHGNAAYGVKDKRFKGDLNFGYLGSASPWSKTSIYLKSDYDFFLGLDDEMEKDNIINSIFQKRHVPFRQTFIKEIALLHEQQIGRSWRNKSSIGYKEYDPSFPFKYTKNPGATDVTTDQIFHKLSVAEFKTNFRFAFNEKVDFANFVLLKFNRPTNLPILNIDYTHGFKALNAPFSYNKVNVGISQFLNLPPKSLLYYNFQVGRTFGTLPYLLLNIPNGNAYYVSSRYAFNTMVPYEFVADKYISFQSRLSLGGLLLDRIPFIQKLGWRERVTYNMFWGSLSAANKQFNQLNDVRTTDTVPFAEVGVGIENIFSLLSIEYIQRLNYLDGRRKRRGTIYVGVNFAF